MFANTALQFPIEPPEWRRSGPFLLLAALLHAVFVYSVDPWSRHSESEPLPLSVTLTQKPMPLPLAPEKPVSKPLPQAQAPANPTRERHPPRPTPTPVLAMTPEQQLVATASAVVAPPAPPAPVAAEATSAKASGSAASSTGNALTAARFDAAYLQNPKPNYPALSRRLGEEGKVMLKVRVSSEGKPLNVDLEKSSGFERLDNSARQAVLGWRFVPAKRGDEAIEATVIVPVSFRLDS